MTKKRYVAFGVRALVAGLRDLDDRDAIALFEKVRDDLRNRKRMCRMCCRVVVNKLRCARCTRTQPERRRSYYERKKAYGLCVTGGCDRAPDAGRTRCSRCAKKNAEARAELRRRTGR